MSHSILDDVKQLSENDQDGLLLGAQSFADQAIDAWEQVKQADFSKLGQFQNVIVAGMGGSSLGADYWRSVLLDQTIVPLTIVNDYVLPKYANHNTLVILISFSGSTEEILAAAQDAKERNCQVVVMAAGGKLIELAKTNNWSHFLVNPSKNGSKQGRMAIGYVLMGVLGIFSATKVMSITEENAQEVIAAFAQQVASNTPIMPTETNPAKTLAWNLMDREVSLIGADFLAGPLHLAANQFHENAKTFARHYVLPELNHHLMEGLKFPDITKDHRIGIFFQSEFYHPRNQKRLDITADVFNEAEVEVILHQLHTKSKLAQAVELTTLTSFASIYLAILEGIDPGPLPIVDAFKHQLS